MPPNNLQLFVSSKDRRQFLILETSNYASGSQFSKKIQGGEANISETVVSAFSIPGEGY